MRIFLVIIALGFSAMLQAQKVEVEHAIKEFFIGFHAKDTVKIKSICDENMILQSVLENKTESTLKQEKATEFFTSIAKIPNEVRFEEKILSYKIKIDGAMAHAWTPYEFYLNGKFSHEGVNSFTLFRTVQGWKIVHIIDTRRR